MQLNVREAHRLVVRMMSALGHDAADAGLIADHLIDCDLRGLSYGGLARAISIAERIARCGDRLSRQPLSGHSCALVSAAAASTSSARLPTCSDRGRYAPRRLLFTWHAGQRREKPERGA
jgi:hypothetical protein